MSEFTIKNVEEAAHRSAVEERHKFLKQFIDECNVKDHRGLHMLVACELSELLLDVTNTISEKEEKKVVMKDALEVVAQCMSSRSLDILNKIKEAGNNVKH